MAESVGCGHRLMCICHHDALYDVVYHPMFQDNSGCRREQCCGPYLDRPGDAYHPDFTCGKPAYLVCSSLQDLILNQSAVSVGVAASRGELEKDTRHEAEVHRAGGIFIPLRVEMLGLCSVVQFEMFEGDYCPYKKPKPGSHCSDCQLFFRTIISNFMEAYNSHFFAPFWFVARQPFMGVEF